MCSRFTACQGLHHTVSSDHGGSIVIGVLIAVGRISQHDIVIRQRYPEQRLAVVYECWVQVHVNIDRVAGERFQVDHPTEYVERALLVGKERTDAA